MHNMQQTARQPAEQQQAQEDEEAKHGGLAQRKAEQVECFFTYADER
jgi:hypothetical protein